jgi:hypothetical protein
MQRRILVQIAILVVGLVALLGCQASSQDVIVGKWQRDELPHGAQSQVLEFLEDGQVLQTVEYKHGAHTDTGKYYRHHGNHIHITWDVWEWGYLVEEEYKVEISENRMTLERVLTMESKVSGTSTYTRLP